MPKLFTSQYTATRVYITPDDVAARVLGNSPDYLVIDVRTPEEFAAGNIRLALSVWSRQFESPASVSQIIATHITPRLPELKMVITHCHQSKFRGPLAADQLRRHPAWPEGVDVVVMEGGWQAYRKAFKGRPELMENASRGEKEVVENEHSVELREREQRESS